MALYTDFSPVWSCLLHNSLLWFHGGFWLRSGLFLLGGRGGTAALGAVVGWARVAALPLTAHGRRPPARGWGAGLASGERQRDTHSMGTASRDTHSTGTASSPEPSAPRDSQHCLQHIKHTQDCTFCCSLTGKLRRQTKNPTPSKWKLTRAWNR